MVRPYSQDLRERSVRAVDTGTSRNAAAKRFDVGVSFVVKLMQRWKQRGTIKADGNALDDFSPAECRNDLLNAGYSV